MCRARFSFMWVLDGATIMSINFNCDSTVGKKYHVHSVIIALKFFSLLKVFFFSFVCVFSVVLSIVGWVFFSLPTRSCPHFWHNFIDNRSSNYWLHFSAMCRMNIDLGRRTTIQWAWIRCESAMLKFFVPPMPCARIYSDIWVHTKFTKRYKCRINRIMHDELR